jgi:hypothetical protein
VKFDYVIKFHLIWLYYWRTEEATEGGGVEWEPNKIHSQETGLCPTFKNPKQNSWRKVMETTKQQDENDPHEVTKPAKEEWDRTYTQLAKNTAKTVNKHQGETIS